MALFTNAEEFKIGTCLLYSAGILYYEPIPHLQMNPLWSCSRETKLSTQADAPLYKKYSTRSLKMRCASFFDNLPALSSSRQVSA